MYMAEGLDTGDMLLVGKIAIEDQDNFETIHDKLATCGAETLLRTIAAIEAGTLTRVPQNDAEATYAAKIEKADCLIDFSKDAKAVHDQIRGLSPIPLSFTHLPNGKLLKVTEARVGDLPTSGRVGEVLTADNEGITVACGTGSVTLLRVVPEGKKPMAAADFVRGRQCAVGDIFE
jgi:methionyl-tRNA formyltransferase